MYPRGKPESARVVGREPERPLTARAHADRTVEILTRAADPADDVGVEPSRADVAFDPETLAAKLGGVVVGGGQRTGIYQSSGTIPISERFESVR
jgi:hypothetical protein